MRVDLKLNLSTKDIFFSFQIMHFQFLCITVQTAPSYNGYIFQLILYSKVCICYHGFLERGWMLTWNQWYQDFYWRHFKLLEHYEFSVSQMLTYTNVSFNSRNHKLFLFLLEECNILKKTYHRLCYCRNNTTSAICGALPAYPFWALENNTGFVLFMLCLG